MSLIEGALVTHAQLTRDIGVAMSSVQGPPLRPVTFPQSVYQGGGSRVVSVADSWSENLALSGRLASLCSKSQSGAPGHKEGHGPCARLGPQGKFGEKQSRTNTACSVCGVMFQLSHCVGLPHSSEGCKAGSPGRAVSAWQADGGSSDSETARDDLSSSVSGSLGPAQSSAFAEVAKCFPSSSKTGQTGKAQDNTAVYTSPPPLEGQIPLDWWGFQWGMFRRGERWCPQMISLTGWGAVWEGRTVRGVWSPQQRGQYINLLELRAVHLALMGLLPFIRGKHVLVKSDNSSTVYHINHQGGTRSLCLQATRELLL
ncbi:uncharacterized protein LOC125902818 [Epinephelus fuscoguttatus]|uniref:uncharacterized protein LOC125902818 n=1 Tax=Epinephelus fuscoguttatus TaxID=293821 RepID=UPI0020D072FD|nr:uncharacterized protein LOC125902818 [Epinephelus fuscoguttatus]